MNRLISAQDLRGRIEKKIFENLGPENAAFNVGLYTALIEISLSDTIAFVDENDNLYRSTTTFIDLLERSKKQ